MRGAVDETNIVFARAAELRRPRRRESAGPGASRRCAAGAAHGPGTVERTGVASQGGCSGAGRCSAVSQMAQRSGSSSNAAAARPVGTLAAALGVPGVGART